MSGTPEWLDDKGKIIEHRYCQYFLEQYPLLSKGEDFFTTEGIVTDKDRQRLPPHCPAVCEQLPDTNMH